MHLLEQVSRRAFTQFTSTRLSKHSSSRLFFPKLYSCGLLTMRPGGPRLRLLTRGCRELVGRRRDPPRISQEASCPPCFQEPRPGNSRLDACHRHVDAERPVHGPVDRPTGQPGPGGVVNAPTSPQPLPSPMLGAARQDGAQRVSLHVATHGQEMLVGLYGERLRDRGLAAGDDVDFSPRIRAQIVMP
jgi:hypothetical protein